MCRLYCVVNVAPGALHLLVSMMAGCVIVCLFGSVAVEVVVVALIVVARVVRLWVRSG